MPVFSETNQKQIKENLPFRGKKKQRGHLQRPVTFTWVLAKVRPRPCGVTTVIFLSPPQWWGGRLIGIEHVLMVLIVKDVALS